MPTIPTSLPCCTVQDRLLTRKEVCFLLGVVRQTVWAYEKRGLAFFRGKVAASKLADFLILEDERQKEALRARGKKT